jgi:hypothetical protein
MCGTCTVISGNTITTVYISRVVEVSDWGLLLIGIIRSRGGRRDEGGCDEVVVLGDDEGERKPKIDCMHFA